MEKNLFNTNLKKKYNQKEINILKSELNYDNLIIPPIPNINKITDTSMKTIHPVSSPLVFLPAD